MPTNVKLLGARRAYEFRSDELRLSVLSMESVRQRLNDLFHFQAGGIGAPIPTFGTVPTPLPPGLVLDFGAFLSPDGLVVPIRFLHFEQRRIVIDVAGPSSAIDGIFAQLFEGLSDLHASDGSPVIGTPDQILEYSEVSAQFSFDLDEILAPALRTLVASTRGTGERTNDMVIAPTLYIQVQPKAEESPGGITNPNSRILQFAFRTGTRPDERIYFSGAPLDSEAHLAYLSAFERSVAKP